MSSVPRTSRDTDAVPLIILHVLAPGHFGGLERVVHAIASGHREAGHRVYIAAVLSAPDPDHPLLGALREAGVEVHPIIAAGRSYWTEYAALLALCDRVRPDLVHTHGYRPDVLAGSVARRRGLPVISTVHGFTGGGWKNRSYEWLQLRALRRVEAVAAVARSQLPHLSRAGIAAGRVHVVPNAWRPSAAPLAPAAARRELKIEEGVLHIGWVGRLSHEKGADVLVDALKDLPDLPLVVSVLGDGRERGALQAQAAAAGLADRIRWHGAVEDAGRYFPAFDAFVLSSRTEGTPMVLFEAMEALVPIVATRVGGVPDVVSPDEALLVPPEDPTALAGGIRAVCSDPERATIRAAAARRRLENAFGYEAWLDRYLTLYKQLKLSTQRGFRW